MRAVAVKENDSKARGSAPTNENFISRSAEGAESNGEGPRCVR